MPEIAINIEDLAAGRSRLEMHGKQAILVCRSATGYYATDGICPHQVKTMDGARVRANGVICPHHGARFQLDGGQSLSPSITQRPLTIYPTRLEGTSLFVSLPD